MKKDQKEEWDEFNREVLEKKQRARLSEDRLKLIVSLIIMGILFAAFFPHSCGKSPLDTTDMDTGLPSGYRRATPSEAKRIDECRAGTVPLSICGGYVSDDELEKLRLKRKLRLLREVDR